MPQEPNRAPKSRENILAIALTGIAVSIGVFYLYLISLGIVLNVLGIGLGIILLGWLHYVFWGRAFSDEVAAEREALLRKEAREDFQHPAVPADAIQDLSRTQGIHRK